MNEIETKQPSLEDKFRETVKDWYDIPKVFSDEEKSVFGENADDKIIATVIGLSPFLHHLHRLT